MTWAHLHLALNHVPVVGIPVAVLLLGIGMLRRSRELTRTAFWLLAGLALVTVFVYLTGEPAEEMVEGLAGVSEPVLEQHEEAALVATVATAIVGFTATIGLIWSRGGRPGPRRYAILILLLGLVATGVLGWTANLGGQIRHSEIRSADRSPMEDLSGGGRLGDASRPVKEDED